jgi:single-stranded DNA-binding protein
MKMLGKREGGEQSAPAPQQRQAPAPKPQQNSGGGFGDFDDDIPFNSIGRGIHAYSI